MGQPQGNRPPPVRFFRHAAYPMGQPFDAQAYTLPALQQALRHYYERELLPHDEWGFYASYYGRRTVYSPAMWRRYCQQYNVPDSVRHEVELAAIQFEGVILLRAGQVDDLIDNRDDNLALAVMHDANGELHVLPVVQWGLHTASDTGMRRLGRAHASSLVWPTLGVGAGEGDETTVQLPSWARTPAELARLQRDRRPHLNRRGLMVIALVAILVTALIVFVLYS